MKRLFEVVPITGKPSEPRDYFEDKGKAKALRDKRNEKAKREAFKIIRGPDHHTFRR
jgi:hypothetical protein